MNNGQSGIAVADAGLVGCRIIETETVVHVKETDIQADRAQMGDLLDAIATALLQGVEVLFRPAEAGLPMRVTAQRYHPRIVGPWWKSQATRFVSPGYCAAQALRESTAEVLAAVELPAERQHREGRTNGIEAGPTGQKLLAISTPAYAGRNNFVPPRGSRPAGFA